ncbi:pentatricopeptide repeat-containing protein At3g53360, mitochondrial-like [Selaginella moellendorffii]|uniref:pentatricopeptide repeat-containing protein At3g53360, mitochondrial-like n=1 Tax=Selaginella moellendorffii TaxID=88036 RepID=UPI000D1C9409|nr:pentatricopeptide repeat-containing protein At3g53360, mitochondrial-like [Selaginella moellendorffii]|eukprot:XP_024515051.1 pentatricopeptide repeat-containing protein At3g53360, mitochondrial-like [Selaginella moellendorffii]
MEAAMINPDCSSFLMAIKTCSSLAAREEIDASLAVKIKSLKRALAIHSHASNSRGFKLEASFAIHLANAMVDLYGKCESLEDARRVFDSMEQHDIVSWTSIITGYAHESQDGDEAFLLFSSMQEQGFKPDRLACLAAIKACSDELALECYAALEVAPNSQTFLALLQVCRNLGDLKLGKLFHAQILRQGLEGSSVGISLLVLRTT